MTRNRGLTVGLALLGVALAWFLRRPEAPGPPDAPSAQRARPPKRAARSGPVKAVPDDAPEPDPPAREALEAVAEIAGEGAMRCPAGPLADGPLAVAGLSNASVRNGQLLATAVSERGAVDIPDPDAEPGAYASPIATLVWDGAWPGEVGRCQVAEPELVSIHGVVVGPDGQALANHVVKGCGDQATTDQGGAFTLQTTAGIPCVLHARPGDNPAGFGLGTELVPADGLDVTVEQTAPISPQPGGAALVDAFLAGGALGEPSRDPLGLALEGSELSPDAREIIEGWVAARDEIRGREADIREFIETNETVDPDTPKR